ncbi:MAG: FHA domain-containing protein [Planctomycetota bacterium]
MNLEEAIYELLGVPPEQQPADYYRLLGLARFEANREVIANAASRQMLFVRQLSTGPYAGVSRKLLDLLSAAKLCLLSTPRRQAYDAELRENLFGQALPSSEDVLDAEDSIALPMPGSDVGLSVVGSRDEPELQTPEDPRAHAELLQRLSSFRFDPNQLETDGVVAEPADGVGSGSLSVTSAFGPDPGRRVMAPLGKPVGGAEVSSAHAFPGGPPYAGRPDDVPATGKVRQWIVGSDSHCDIVVRCPYVSRRHCKVLESSGRYWVEDLGSRNGTHVNNRVAEGRVPVTGEDLITLGTLARMPWPPANVSRASGSHEVRIVRIGRAPSNDVTLSHSSVSRRHAQLTILGDQLVLEDLGSTNGTFVGDSSLRINRATVQPTDLVRIGKFSFPVSHLLRAESVA